MQDQGVHTSGTRSVREHVQNKNTLRIASIESS